MHRWDDSHGTCSHGGWDACHTGHHCHRAGSRSRHGSGHGDGCAATLAGDELDGDRVALVALALIVDIAECARKTVVVDVAATKSKRVVAAV